MAFMDRMLAGTTRLRRRVHAHDNVPIDRSRTGHRLTGTDCACTHLHPCVRVYPIVHIQSCTSNSAAAPFARTVCRYEATDTRVRTGSSPARATSTKTAPIAGHRDRSMSIVLQPPVPETYTPVIHDCITSPTLHIRADTSVPSNRRHNAQHRHGTVASVAVAAASVQGNARNGAAARPRTEQVTLVRRHNAKQAYKVIPSMGRVNLDHHADGWGDVCFAICLPRVADAPLACHGGDVGASASPSVHVNVNVDIDADASTDVDIDADVDADVDGLFQMPRQQGCTYVAIKRMDKAVVRTALAAGTNENPYKEIHRMQELGDDRHVLSCIEALQDDKWLYIVMPYCEQKSLVEWLPWEQGVQEHQARQVFRQVVENVQYLQSRGICHRDLSPDNCMIYNGRVVLTDLAMSFRVPESDWVTPLGGFGKPAYLPPEVFMDHPFEARACDTWSLAVILFNILTGHHLCSLPHPADHKFRYLVMMGGISNSDLNERTYEMLMSEADGNESDERREMRSLVLRCLDLSPEAQHLLQGLLMVDRANRWSLDDMLNSLWMQQEE